MERKIETKQDGKEFERFDDLLRKVVAVPKEEINRREKADRHEKDKKREKKKG